MRKTTALIFLILIASGYAFCQTEIYRDASVLDKVTQLQGMDVATRVSENVEIERAVPKRRTSAEDSIVIEHRSFTVHTNRVVLDAEKVKQVFPEVVTSTSDGRADIDFNSLIAVLLEAMGRQQVLIDELNMKISLLEGKKPN